jgi:uncharacterized protein (DUF433 family)
MDKEEIARYIAPDSLERGVEEARLLRYGVPIWALIGHMRAINGSPEQVAYDYDIPLDVMKAALEYYKLYRHAIDARIAANVA